MGKKLHTVSIGIAITAAFLTALFMKLFLFDFMVAEGPSMEPAIAAGSILLINRVAYGFRFPWAKGYLFSWAEPKQGDVVIFQNPLGNVAVKRCSQIHGDKFFAQGDNTDNSYDSRSYGPVRIDMIIGKVMGIK